ncbi:MAG: glycosyltransferase family 2 protein [Nanoarchaeota archaeon]
MKLSIIIPCYNEQKTVGEVIDKVKSIKLSVDKEIIVVDDGSSDRSYDIIKSKKGVRIFRHERNIGKGAAVKTALKNITGDLFIIQDSDLELDPQEIEKVSYPIIKGETDVVYGSRMPKLGKLDRHPLFYFGGMFVTLITNLLYKTKITDEPCGYKAFKTYLFKDIKIKEDGFGWEPEVTAKLSKRGVKIHEVPVSHSNSRSAKDGKKLRVKDGFKAIWILIKYRIID